MSRGKSAWALFAALAAALLALQLFTHTAPIAAVHKPETTTSQGEAVDYEVCDAMHSSSEEMSEHSLTRDRQRADEHASDGPSRSTQITDTNAVAAPSASSPNRDTHSRQRPASDLSPAALQVFRC
ncbi:hypothetical protein [Streptomyces sp. NBC_00024]|uniref:hypothetical protein n=1 Tax=Streptomyces sp. NBC_00024 TaxID=2903612 RepID=UPI003251F56B